MSNLIWGRVPAGLLWIPWWFPGAGWWVECVDSVGRGRQVEAVKYKKGQANYATKFLTRNIESKTGSEAPFLCIPVLSVCLIQALRDMYPGRVK